MAEAPGGHALSLVDALRVGGISHGLRGADKPTVLRAIVDSLALPSHADRESVRQLLIAREALGSTAIGEGIAIPHVRRPLLFGGSPASMSLFFLEHPIDFDAFDGEPAFAIFLLVSPTSRTHLQMLSRLSFALHDSGVKAALALRASSAEILAEFQRVEAAMRQGAHQEHREQLHTRES